jgi:hypothetical protein
VSADVTVEVTATHTDVAADPDLLAATLETLATAAHTVDDAIELRVKSGEGLVAIEIFPFDPGEEGTIPDLVLDIARLVAGHAEWSVDTNDRSGVPTVSVRLSAVRDNSAQFHSGSEST